MYDAVKNAQTNSRGDAVRFVIRACDALAEVIRREATNASTRDVVLYRIDEQNG